MYKIKMLKFLKRMLFSVVIAVILTLLMKNIFQTKIPSESLNPNRPFILGKFKGANLIFFVGDICLPNDMDTRLDIYKPDVTRIVYDSYIISSVLTEKGEAWTWLPKTVGECIYAIDKTLGEKYKKEIIDGINWRNHPNETVIEFKVPKNSKYGSISHIRTIYAISLFNALNKIDASIKRKQRLQKTISLSIKHILEKYVSPSPENSRVCIPALSGVWGTIDSQFYLSYYQSWSSILNGIARINDTKGIDEIYFVVWEQLLKNKQHFQNAINGFIQAFDVFNGTYTKAIFLVCLVASILGMLFKYSLNFTSNTFKEIIVSIVPGLLSIFGMLKSDVLSYNFISFLNTHYYLVSIMFGTISFYWSFVYFKEK